MEKDTLKNCHYCNGRLNKSQICIECGKISFDNEQQEIYDNVNKIKCVENYLLKTRERQTNFSIGCSTFSFSELYKKEIEKIKNQIKKDKVFENAQQQKFLITADNENSFTFFKLTPNGRKTVDDSGRTWKKHVLAKMIKNKVYSFTNSIKRESYTDLRSFGFFDLMKK